VEHVDKAPGKPLVLSDECCAENNSITVAWQAAWNSRDEGYVLEIDNGNGDGKFRVRATLVYIAERCNTKSLFQEAYSGPRTVHTVENLQFSSTYQCRVRAFNGAGHGLCSDLVRLRTADGEALHLYGCWERDTTLDTVAVAWFQLDAGRAHADVEVSGAARCRAAGSGAELRTVLGSVGLSRGRHFWRVRVDRRDNNADVVLGVASLDVDRNLMLGESDGRSNMSFSTRNLLQARTATAGQCTLTASARGSCTPRRTTTA